jgi:hypothetical protein
VVTAAEGMKSAWAILIFYHYGRYTFATVKNNQVTFWFVGHSYVP